MCDNMLLDTRGGSFHLSFWPIRCEAWRRRCAPARHRDADKWSVPPKGDPCQRLGSALHCPRFLHVTLNGHHYPPLSETPRSHITGEQISLSFDGPLPSFKADTLMAEHNNIKGPRTIKSWLIMEFEVSSQPWNWLCCYIPTFISYHVITE